MICQADNQGESLSAPAGWQQVWHDEFDVLDGNKWQFEVNCWGGGNNEQQCYTPRSENAYIDNGVLHIVARKEDFRGPAQQDDQPGYDINDTSVLKPYTSARLRTKHLAQWTYGRFEIRAKLPQGQGTWPAIWMLPTNNRYGSWPASGEIDIMEAVNLGANSDRPSAPAGELETRVHGTLHYGREFPENVYAGTGYRLANEQSPAADFHVYAIEWEATEIRWYVDNIHYATQTSATWYSQAVDEAGQWQEHGNHAPFNHPFHLLLNLAVGGGWAGTVNDTGVDSAVFPQVLSIDYVRVYQCQPALSDARGCASQSPQARLVIGAPKPAINTPSQPQD
nr:glycoside hydrolase family 16 protein [Shewanella sp. NIFS-20-20]